MMHDSGKGKAKGMELRRTQSTCPAQPCLPVPPHHQHNTPCPNCPCICISLTLLLCRPAQVLPTCLHCMHHPQSLGPPQIYYTPMIDDTTHNTRINTTLGLYLYATIPRGWISSLWTASCSVSVWDDEPGPGGVRAISICTLVQSDTHASLWSLRPY